VYLLDTNVCIAVLRRAGCPAAARLRRCDPGEIRLSAVSVAELLYGAWRSSRASENVALVKRFAEPLECLPFDSACAEEAAVIRAQLAAAGTPIGPYDVLIAATARVHGLILVTHNTREFERVAGLRTEDWERG